MVPMDIDPEITWWPPTRYTAAAASEPMRPSAT